MGAAGSIAYLYLLNKSIDAVGAGASIVEEEEAESGGGLQAPRLLIPMIMAMGYNRRVCRHAPVVLRACWSFIGC